MQFLEKILATTRFEFMRLLTVQRLALSMIMALFPPAMLFLVGENTTPEIVPFFISALVLFIGLLSLLLWATPNVHGELEAKSWSYITSRHGGRFAILFGKYLNAMIWTIMVSWTSAALCIAFAEGLRLNVYVYPVAQNKNTKVHTWASEDDLEIIDLQDEDEDESFVEEVRSRRHERKSGFDEDIVLRDRDANTDLEERSEQNENQSDKHVETVSPAPPPRDRLGENIKANQKREQETADYDTAMEYASPGGYYLLALTGLILVAAPFYAAVFSLMGVLFSRKSMVFGAAYVVISELVLASVPANVNKLTGRYHLTTIASEFFGFWILPLPKEEYEALFGRVSFWGSMATLVSLTLILMTVAALVIRFREYITSDEAG